MSYFGATGTPLLDFWWCLLWVLKPEWVLPYSLFVEANVMYILQDPLLVLHLLTSWRLAYSRSLIHMHVQRWDLAQIRTSNHPDRVGNNLIPIQFRFWTIFVQILPRNKTNMLPVNKRYFFLDSHTKILVTLNYFNRYLNLNLAKSSLMDTLRI